MAVQLVVVGFSFSTSSPPFPQTSRPALFLNFFQTPPPFFVYFLVCFSRSLQLSFSYGFPSLILLPFPLHFLTQSLGRLLAFSSSPLFFSIRPISRTYAPPTRPSFFFSWFFRVLLLSISLFSSPVGFCVLSSRGPFFVQPPFRFCPLSLLAWPHSPVDDQPMFPLFLLP